jgi:hypothetical protein
MLARRQLLHGDLLSQRTLRVRHTRQLRDCAVVGLAGDDPFSEAGEFAFFSEADADSAMALFTAAVCRVRAVGVSEGLGYTTVSII